jgi:hypothetical protein
LAEAAMDAVFAQYGRSSGTPGDPLVPSASLAGDPRADAIDSSVPMDETHAGASFADSRPTLFRGNYDKQADDVLENISSDVLRAPASSFLTIFRPWE